MAQKPDVRWRQRFQSFGKAYAQCRGATDLYGSKDATREALAQGLISNGDEWVAMIAARNRSTRTYNEKTAHEVVQRDLVHA